MFATAEKNIGVPPGASVDALRSVVGSIQTSQLRAIAGIAPARSITAAIPYVNSVRIQFVLLTFKLFPGNLCKSIVIMQKIARSAARVSSPWKGIANELGDQVFLLCLAT